MIRIGIVATSSVVPKIEFNLGVEHLKANGFEVEVHSTVLEQDGFYPATDELRARAFLDFAFRDDLQALWCARGGYGATHLLPFLEKASRKKKPKKKLLLGYSDATALMEFARTRWGWKTIHAPMPSLRTFSILPAAEWSQLLNLIDYEVLKKPLKPTKFKLEPIFIPKGFKKAEAPVVGGNLFVWNSLLGTPYVGKASGKILVLEEIGENMGRVNRMLHHLEQAGGFKGAKALVLGDFTDCNDTVAQTIQRLPGAGEVGDSFLKSPPASVMAPIRQVMPPQDALTYVFRALGERNQLPVFKGLPIGHGDQHFSVDLGRSHILRVDGTFIQIE